MEEKRQSKRYSVAALYMSMGGVDPDDDIDDELAKAQKHLRELKQSISEQSKRNFVLEKDVRYLDSRIALLIQNRMALEEQNEVASRLDDMSDEPVDDQYFPDRKKQELYGNLFFLLQSEPKHIALLCRLVSMAEIDSLLQTVMFTIYGNQYEQREEHLLLTMFKAVLAHQFDTTAEFSSLLRANTPVSRMMTTYTRRGPGQSYLRAALSDRLAAIINDTSLNLEINPLKVYEELLDPTEVDDPFNRPSVTSEQAERDERVIALIRPRHVQLNQLANDVLDTIIGSLDLVPYGIRWICKQIRLLARRQFPGASDTAVCSLIGGFFFLRFVNPAIVTPQAYMLVERLPADNSRRNLTLIAKLLQNLANKPSYSKEPFMANLSGFVDSNRSKINKFLNDMCEVPDFYESLEMDQYVALSKMDLVLNITLNEMYGMHALLDKYRDGVVQSDDSHLAVLLAELGPSPGLVPRTVNGSMELGLFNRWETAVGDVDTDMDVFRADMMFMETKSLMINIIRQFPTGHPVLTTPLELRRIADFAASSSAGGDEGLVKRGIKALDLLAEMGDDSEDAVLLNQEIEYELKQLGSLKEAVLKEAVSLEEVYSIIREHNEYLRSQLDTFRSYLDNVRKHTGTKRDRPAEFTKVNNKADDPEKAKTGKKIVIRKYSPLQLEKDGVVAAWRIPESRLVNLMVYMVSPIAGTYVVSLILKTRPNPIVTMDLKLDDLLELSDQGLTELDLECVVFSIKGLLATLRKDVKHR